MPTSTEAEEHLRVIRSLMEKATIYRAISAPTALVGALASMTATVALSWALTSDTESVARLRVTFFVGWLAVLAITAVANTWLLSRDARRRGDVFLSAGMRAAVRAFSPSYLAAAFFTVLFANSPEFLPPGWMIFYGLGLLATQHFAPRSIALLGWAFLAVGLVLILCGFWSVSSVVATRIDQISLLHRANLAMGLTFGFFHLIYAACAWPRKPAGVAAGRRP